MPNQPRKGLLPSGLSSKWAGIFLKMEFGPGIKRHSIPRRKTAKCLIMNKKIYRGGKLVTYETQLSE
jgi:hypothetical protein